jgi:GcrA cell cycle regulator
VSRGLSFAKAAAAINARFGTSYTRNAAIGRGKRMGLVGSSAMSEPKRPKARKRPVPGQSKPTTASGASAPGTLASSPPVAGAPTVATQTLATQTHGPQLFGTQTPGTQTGCGPAAAPPVQLRCVGISPRLLSLVELEPGDCRYPYGGDKDDEPIAFCGHPRRPGSSYCAPHFQLTRELDTVAERAVAPIRLRLVLAA